MNSYFRFALILLFVSNKSFSQEVFEDCAYIKESKKDLHGVKSLTAIEEVQANKYDVHFYQLDLAMTNLNTSVSGTAAIHATSLEILDSVVFELFPTLTISEIRLNGIITPYNRTNSVLKIPINAPANFSFIVEVDYGGIPPNPGTNPFGGSGVTSSYVAAIANRVTWTVSCPFLAHEWFPCKQILRDKADSCAVNITAPSTCKVGSNGLLENVIDLGNGTTRYEWKHRAPILYYLIFASIAPYVEYNLYAHPAQIPGDSVLIQNYVYGSAATLPAVLAQCDLLPDFVELFSDIFGLYPFHEEKYGHCFAPLGGGMEHQTMTTIGVSDKRITAHELGHEWWGDDVGIASFSDVWLSEGFATYSEYVMYENRYPAERAALLNGWHGTVKGSAGGSVWFTDTLNISRIYNSRLTYKKGGSIIHTLRHIVNNDALFFQTLRDFQFQFHDSVAVGLDVKNTFEMSTGIDLTNFFEEWYFGEGFPTYSARWNTNGNDLILEVSHTSSMPSVTPTFTNPLEVSFSRNGLSDTTMRFDINANTNQFFIQNVGEITSLNSFDPNNWIINNNGMISFDPSFTAYAGAFDVKNEIATIFPNPSNGIFNMKMNENGNYILRVMDAKGETLQVQKINENCTLNIENYTSGSYILEITSENSDLDPIRKIIKKIN